MGLCLIQAPNINKKQQQYSKVYSRYGVISKHMHCRGRIIYINVFLGNIFNYKNIGFKT